MFGHNKYIHRIYNADAINNQIDRIESLKIVIPVIKSQSMLIAVTINCEFIKRGKIKFSDLGSVQT